MKPEDVYALTSVGDPRLSPDGRRVAYVVSRIDEEANAYRTAIWVAPLDGSAEPRQFTSGERNDGSPALVSRRTLARLRLESRRRGREEGEGPALRHAGRRRRAAEADRRQGVRRVGRVVARLEANRLRAPRARRGVRGGGRPPPAAATVHPRLLQARRRRLDRRPPQARLRRRPRRRRRAAAHRRRLRERLAGVGSRRQAPRLHLHARRPLGRRLLRRRSTSSRWMAREPSRSG